MHRFLATIARRCPDEALRPALMLANRINTIINSENPKIQKHEFCADWSSLVRNLRRRFLYKPRDGRMTGSTLQIPGPFPIPLIKFCALGSDAA